MRKNLVETTIKQLVSRGIIIPSLHSVIASCASEQDYYLLKSFGFVRIALVGLDPSLFTLPDDVIKSSSDAMHLPFSSGSYDWAFVSDGLHHCSSPHAALLELYRVARIGVIAFESRDNLSQRAAELLFWPRQTYEIDAVSANFWKSGGVNNTSVPNYIYRWTEREFQKVIQSYDPSGPQQFFFYNLLNLPTSRHPLLRLIQPLIFSVFFFLPKQRNSLAMVAVKPVSTYPWIRI